jgi:CRISPR/Cas system-associated exonuclease Cas4 (RecB family)
MHMLPVDRALAIYETIANRSELKGTRARLSQHLRKVFLEGEHDPHRLTVHGLTYLQNLDRERDR